MEINTVIDDAAYSEKANINYTKESSAGLFGMEIQGATAMFAVNPKRILTLLREKE
ncbi:hypothetical protein [Psychrobacillus soli]|uniref:hypothetical protein n=1 Tax=Psychrobacillus soli TaxID=1543965 RepID=UPI00163CC47B|nr:hypothetical protein [Psychrobacillus soli]